MQGRYESAVLTAEAAAVAAADPALVECRYRVAKVVVA